MSASYPPGQPESGLNPAMNPATNPAMNQETDQASRAGMTGGGSGDADRSAYLRSELTTLKSELDTLLEHVATLSESELREAYGRITARFSSARHAAKGMAAQAGQQFNRQVDATTGYVKENPLQAVGIAVGAGLLLGLLMGRR